MKRYVVALEKEERDELAGITRKGSHQSQKVVNALILLNCDEGEFNEHRARGEAIAEVLRISARKVDRVKKRFVEEGKHGSWLNVAEVELSVMIRQCLNRRIASLRVLRDEVAAWQASRDRIQTSQLAVHHGRRPRESQTPLSDI